MSTEIELAEELVLKALEEGFDYSQSPHSPYGRSYQSTTPGSLSAGGTGLAFSLNKKR